jgi:hypothetical protein
VQDINDSGAGQVFSAEQLVPQTHSSGPKELGLKFSIPIFFFQGGLHDSNCACQGLP